jgi:hypothetical protein
MIRTYLIENPVITTILLFSVIFFTLQIGQPKFLYNYDGSLKPFGIGFKRKTVFPLWIFAIVIAVLCYTFVMFSVVNYKFF